MSCMPTGKSTEIRVFMEGGGTERERKIFILFFVFARGVSSSCLSSTRIWRAHTLSHAFTVRHAADLDARTNTHVCKKQACRYICCCVSATNLSQIFIYVRVNIYTYMYMCIYVYVCIWINIYMYIHIYEYACSCT